MTALPSIRGRLWRSLLLLALGWGLSVATVVWLWVQQEVDELLDDTLRQASVVFVDLLQARGDSAAAGLVVPDPGNDDDRFAWQLVGPGPRVLLRSAAAPPEPWVPTLAAGYADAPGWRIYGVAMNGGPRRLYVAQSQRERRDVLLELSLAALAASLLAGLVTVLWLRARVDRELRPLQALSATLAHYEPTDGATLGPPQRDELVPIHDAIGDLGRRLARRIASERAFAAHAAHALRTPLAGIDAQLAVALRDCPPALQPRLQGIRGATTRLARVVAALLALFRSSADVQRRPLDLADLVARMPVDGGALHVVAPGRIDADPDLLAAVLLNLFDNSLRFGATRVTLQVQGGVLTLADDGRGCTHERRTEVLAALHSSDDEQPVGVGLGLRLADVVARAHGGTLWLPDARDGFVVAIRLGPDQPPDG